MSSEIEIKGISKSFGKLEILKNVSISVEENEIFGIIGESGSGKTTLLNIIVGFLEPDKGIISFQSKPISKSIKHMIGFATQENCVYNKLTVNENLEYFGSLYGLTKKQIKENSENILKLVELYDSRNKLAKNLSGGMQRRLNIACSLIHNPRILILDEPTEDLDPLLRDEIINLIRKINKKNTTVILTSHLLDEAERLCNTIAVICNGEIIAHDSPQGLIDSYSKSKELVIRPKGNTQSDVVRIIKTIKEDKIIQERGDEVIVYTTNAEGIFDNLLKKLNDEKIELIKIELKKPSLYEVFEFMVKKENKEDER